jgi:UDP-N-acetylmuramate dehydrogenase
MTIMPTFAELTTIQTGGRASCYSPIETSDSLITTVRHADAIDTPMLVIGEGSNLIVSDAGFNGVVLHVRTRGIYTNGDTVTVEAGEIWDEFVQAMLDDGRGSLVPMSGIPGTIGATPIQNVGAYGAAISQFLTSVMVYDRHDRKVHTLDAAYCGFGNRTSIFKGGNRYVVLRVTFRLPVTNTVTVNYDGLAQQLGLRIGDPAPASRVREAVLALRRSKGMVIDAADSDTRSVGSFFINPVLSAVPSVVAGVPTYPDPAGVKLSAAWLIEQAGFTRGYGASFGRGRVRLSSKHTLAVINWGGATTAEVMDFASHIRNRVTQRFGVRLTPECDLGGCELESSVLQH